jgi:hypothetical protein
MISIEELQAFFNTISLPETIHLEQGVKIINVPAFVQSHLQVLESNGYVPAFSVFYDRLIMLRDLLQDQINS